MQGSGQRELRGARAVTGGLGGSEHGVGADLLCGPQQQNHTVHRPTPTHHHQVQLHTGNFVLVTKFLLQTQKCPDFNADQSPWWDVVVKLDSDQL